MVNFSTEYTLQNSPSTVTKNSLVLYRQVTLILKLPQPLLNFTHWALFQHILDYNKYCHTLVWWILATKYWWGSNYNWDSTICNQNWGHFKRVVFRVYNSFQVPKKRRGVQKRRRFLVCYATVGELLLAISSHCGFLCLVQSDLN